MALDFPGTPATGTTYTGPGGVIWVYDGTKWVSGTLTTGIYAPITNDVGRNLIHNALFNVTQRGTGLVTTDGAFAADRWYMSINLDTLNFQSGTFNNTDRAAIGDEEAIKCVTAGVTTNNTAASFSFIAQNIENVRRLSGKTVTVSFWAQASLGSVKLGVGIRQSFGAGGSTAADMAGKSVTLSSTAGTIARYSVTFAIPGVGANTLGTAGTDYTRLSFWLSSGSTQATIAGSPGLQSYTLALWGVQLEIGTVATPLQKLDPVTELQQCQRFYSVGRAAFSGYQVAGQLCQVSAYFQVSMRGVPIITLVNDTSGNLGARSFAYLTGYTGVVIWGAATASGTVQLATDFTASADL